MNFTYDKNKTEELLNSLKVIPPGKDMALALAGKNRTEYVYNTASLEGNPMTYPEVQTLLDGITVGGHKLSDEQQVLNQNDSWSELIKLVKEDKFVINKEIFCYLQSLVAKEEAIEWGVFRSSEVNIGGTEYKPPKANQLDEIFTQYIKEIEKIDSILLKALICFLFGAINQFFFDGNKRTSRLMMNGVLLSNGYNILNIKAKDRLEFNKKMIEFYNSQDASGILEYLINYYKED